MTHQHAQPPLQIKIHTRRLLWPKLPKLHFFRIKGLHRLVLCFNGLMHRSVSRRLAAVGAMLTLWAWICALEASPGLHHFVHKDAQSPAHHCFVTQLQQHSVHPGSAPIILVSAPTAWISFGYQGQFLAPSSFDYRLSPSRGPPLA